MDLIDSRFASVCAKSRSNASFGAAFWAAAEIAATTAQAHATAIERITSAC
jgi:hypothetical protein